MNTKTHLVLELIALSLVSCHSPALLGGPTIDNQTIVCADGKTRCPLGTYCADEKTLPDGGIGTICEGNDTIPTTWRLKDGGK